MGDFMKYYINTFLIYSIIGYIFESMLKLFFHNSMNNGFLFGPWIPIYGFGVCLIIFIMRIIFNRFKMKRIYKTIWLFIISILTLTLLEFIGGSIIYLFTKKIFWNYSKLKYNIGPFIALEISLIWGISSIIITYVIKPIIDKLIKKIPSNITYLVLFIFLIDFIYTLIIKIII